jgi:hypothetical protein
MATKQEVEHFLNDFKVKLRTFRIIFWDERGKNSQTLLDLDISSNKRKEIIEKLTFEDYSQGPIEDQIYGLPSMWVFGKDVKGAEVYIKISMGKLNSETICISFHPAEYNMNYPLKL